MRTIRPAWTATAAKRGAQIKRARFARGRTSRKRRAITPPEDTRHLFYKTTWELLLFEVNQFWKRGYLLIFAQAMIFVAYYYTVTTFYPSPEDFSQYVLTYYYSTKPLDDSTWMSITIMICFSQALISSLGESALLSTKLNYENLERKLREFERQLGRNIDPKLLPSNRTIRSKLYSPSRVLIGLSIVPAVIFLIIVCSYEAYSRRPLSAAAAFISLVIFALQKKYNIFNKQFESQWSSSYKSLPREDK